MNNLSPKFTLILALSIGLLFTGCVGPSATANQESVMDTAVTQAQLEPASSSVPPPPSAITENGPDTAPQPMAPVAEALVPDSVLAQEQAFITLYEQVNPSVVHINVGVGQGSGFVYDQSGHIVTNHHVIAGARAVEVTFANGRTVPAIIVGTDPTSDLAVVRVDPAMVPLQAVQLADSDALKVGQIVVAIGSPFGLESTMTTGIISALDRSFDGEAGPGGSFQVPDIIQTDAAINPGNSGGPLLDLYGRVIGVNARIESPVRASSGIGYAIPANIVRAVAPQLIANGHVQHPWLGIAGREVNANTASQFGLSDDLRGVLINSVVAGGPAAGAGLQAAHPTTGTGGDLIVAIDNQPVETFDDLLGYIVEHTAVGQVVQLQVLRNGQLQMVSLTLQARPSGS